MNNALLAMLAEAKPGYCAMCDEKLPPRKRVLCGERDCKRLYMKLYIQGQPERRGRVRAEPHPGSLLTEAQVRRIRDAGASGVTRREIAAAYGIGVTTVNNIIQGKTWAHVASEGSEAAP